MPAGVTVVLFSCTCGHRNRVAHTPKESYKLYILDELGNCRKCGRSLRKYQFQLKRTKTFLEVEQELENAGAT
jgi:hypothetical protein